MSLELQVGRYSYDAVTDERGNFLFAHQAMPNLGCSIRLLDEGWVLDQDRAADLIASDRPVELRAVVASEIKGRVQRADGQPAAGARIALEQQGEDGVWNPVAFGRSSREGSFRLSRLHAMARPLRLTLQSRDGGAIADLPTMTLPGAKVDLGVVKLDEPARVEGVVRDAAGQPLRGVVVSLDNADWALGSRRDAGTETVTDRLGRYRFAGVKPGEASLRLFLVATDRQRGDRAVEPFEVAPGGTRTIDLTTKSN